MKIEKAIECVENVLCATVYFDGTLAYELTIDDVDWLEMAKEALEKQTPKEHHHTRVVEVKCKARESVCPACLYVIITKENEYPKHCTWCGQAICFDDGERKENEQSGTYQHTAEMV